MHLATRFVPNNSLTIVQFANLFHPLERHTIDSAASTDNHQNKVTPNLKDNRFEEPPLHLGNSNENDEDKKKKKRNGSLRFDDDDDELDESINIRRRPYGLTRQNINPNRFDQRERDYDELLSECPILDAIDKRCQNVDLISGGGSVGNQFANALLPACGVHQFCYLCVSIAVYELCNFIWLFFVFFFDT